MTEPSDSAAAFHTLTWDEFISDVREEDAGRCVTLSGHYRRGFCSGYRLVDPIIDSLYGAMAQTCERLLRRKAWDNRSVVFRANVDGILHRLYPLVEYQLPRSKRACRLVRRDASYYLADNGRVAVFDDDGGYVVPSQEYWLYNEADRNYVRFLLETVSSYH